MKRETLPSPTPPHSPPPRPIYDVLPPRCLGRLITIAIVALVSLFTIFSQQRNHSIPPSSTPSPLQLTALPLTYTTPPTDTVTLTLTWDEWQDLVNALYYIRSEIDVTFDFVGDDIPPSTATEAQLTKERFQTLNDKLIEAAFIQGENLSDEEFNAIITHQVQRTEELVDLMTDLFNLKFDYLLSPTPQPKKDK